MSSESFKDKHRLAKAAFTRVRSLPFELVLVIGLEIGIPKPETVKVFKKPSKHYSLTY
jgi:hypothetical protein